ncbi:heme biosynthesis protein [Paenibacillus odorifer]|uniref:Heme biosynthesis protein n=1 Tax=Paenibacillus odorifer TaxID=189426 RepID=A0ABX3GF68_9BACL|nr:heme biosynthesis protein [Paenibacillus odorifer]OMC75922.1 heme biosynthesis protein [Paenibacillus odorifer]OMD11942.1 heme biosynthesis protein [Paenibacillus odorifer]OMD64931.1 heme biosynthesis protein [Paenibacillus odorifer]OMD95871.1 heme biosynthesis protein [Paenibacillus odorifer]
MNVTIFFTRDCNLQCSYCYEGEKFSKEITGEIINEIPGFLLEHMRKINDQKINIVTHGGEPLLVFPKIKSFINKTKKTIPKAKFSITTNGTIINDEILELLSNEYENVSISIDGTKEAHDQNRVYKNYSGSFDLVKKNASRLLERRPDAVARMTVTSSNVSQLNQGVIELIRLGFQNIMPVPDENDREWDEQSLEVLLEQCKLITSYLHNNQEISTTLDVGFINDAPNKTKNSVCDGGIGSLTIDTDGKLYPCIIANGVEEFCIGNIFEGIDEEKLVEIHSEDNRVIAECDGCERYHYCTTTRCKIINRIKTGDFNKASGTRCCLEHIFIESAIYTEELVKII